MGKVINDLTDEEIIQRLKNLKHWCNGSIDSTCDIYDLYSIDEAIKVLSERLEANFEEE